MKNLYKLLLLTITLILLPLLASSQLQYKYMPPKNANEMIDNLERFCNQVYVNLESWNDLDKYNDITDKLDEDVNKYKSSLSPAQQKRFDKINKKAEAKRKILDSANIQSSYESPADSAVVAASSNFYYYDYLEAAADTTVAVAVAGYGWDDYAIADATPVVSEEHVKVNYGPAHSEEDLLDKLENIYNEIYVPAEFISDIDKYEDDFKIIGNEIKTFEKTFTDEQKARYDAITEKIQEKDRLLSTKKQNLKPSKYGPAASADKFITNLERFYEDVIVTATTIDIDKEYPNDFKILKNDINKFEDKLNARQKKRYEVIKTKIEKKEQELKEKKRKEKNEEEVGVTEEPVSGELRTSIDSSYGDDLLDRLEKLYNDFFDNLIAGGDQNKYMSEFQLVAEELQKVAPNFTSKQTERFSSIAQEVSRRITEWSANNTNSSNNDEYDTTDTIAPAVVEEPYDGLIPGEEICETCAGTVDELLDNYEWFYDNTFSSVESSDEALEYVNEMQVLQNDINRLESDFNEDQKSRFKKTEKKYKVKAEEIGLVIYPQSYGDE